MRTLLLAVATVVLVSPAYGQAAPRSGVLRVRDSLLVLPDGRSFTPGLRQLRAHGLLDTLSRPYLVLSGFGCDDCDAVRSIYVLRFGEHLNWSKQPWPPVFAYPGTVHDTENQPIARSRLFFGQCRGDGAVEVIQFAHVLSRGGGWADSTHVALLRGESVATTSSTYSPQELQGALERVRRGTCTEVPGDDHQVEP
jgi:hypothetical protein